MWASNPIPATLKNGRSPNIPTSTVSIRSPSNVASAAVDPAAHRARRRGRCRSSGNQPKWRLAADEAAADFVHGAIAAPHDDQVCVGVRRVAASSRA